MKDRIRKVRKNYKLTQPEFGAKLGVSKDAIANLEYGRVEPSPFVIRAICSAFNVDTAGSKTGSAECSPTRTVGHRRIESAGRRTNSQRQSSARWQVEKDWENFKALYEAVKRAGQSPSFFDFDTCAHLLICAP